MVDFDELTIRATAKRRRARKADVDIEVSELSHDRRLAMAARRAADLFDHCAMYATASLLRELSHAADFEVSAATAAFESD